MNRLATLTRSEVDLSARVPYDRSENCCPGPCELSVHLFGKFRVVSGSNAIFKIRSSKVQELFCYLLVHRERMHNRESLSGLLWESMSSSQSRKQLRHALWELQSVLETGRDRDQAQHTNLFVVEPNWVQLNPNAPIRVDVTIFEDAFNAARTVHPRDFTDEGVRQLIDALQLFQGEFLEGWYQDWCLRERSRLQSMRCLVADKLMDHLELTGDYDSAIGYGEDILRVEPARECTHQRLMRLRYLSGDRVAALRQYQLCSAALEEELGVEPARITSRLRDDIETDTLAVTPSPTREHENPSDLTRHSLTQVQIHLNHLKAQLAEMQRQVTLDLEYIEQSLKSPP